MSYVRCVAYMSDSLLRLFDAVEGGDRFWYEEISNRGADQVIELLQSGYYDTRRKSAQRMKERFISRPIEILREEIEQSGSRFISSEDVEWPHLINDLVAPPLGLIIKGAPLHCFAVSIVGTRNPTPYGARIAAEFAAGFVDRGFAVISGGAYGIDSHAHRGAIAGEGKTVAVLASGVNANYPAGNEALFKEISEVGTLVSEVMPFVKARPERFLTRNRIIAALSRSTIIVEAAFRSGSLRTAREAAEILRTVLAVPGPITSPTSDGCHRLIGDRCAEIVTSVADAVEIIDARACTLCGDES